jgi:N6-adenosine-specific RNA methylase IME4
MEKAAARSNTTNPCLLDDIKALPVGNLAAKECALFLWTTFPHLTQALAVIDAWAFGTKAAPHG